MIQTRENYRKPQIWVILGPFAPIMGREIFFAKIGLRHFHRFIEGYLDAKNKKKLMMGSIRTFVTDRRTDGDHFIEPAEWRRFKKPLYKADISLERTIFFSQEGVNFREIPL